MSLGLCPLHNEETEAPRGNLVHSESRGVEPGICSQGANSAVKIPSTPCLGLRWFWGYEGLVDGWYSVAGSTRVEAWG